MKRMNDAIEASELKLTWATKIIYIYRCDKLVLMKSDQVISCCRQLNIKPHIVHKTKTNIFCFDFFFHFFGMLCRGNFFLALLWMRFLSALIYCFKWKRVKENNCFRAFTSGWSKVRRQQWWREKNMRAHKNIHFFRLLFLVAVGSSDFSIILSPIHYIFK